MTENPKFENSNEYRQCSMSVMDTIADPDIRFDQNGVCNYYHEYVAAEAQYCLKGDVGQEKLKQIAQQIKRSASGKKYDCILGLSGGADSTYLALLAKRLQLNPLLVHFDYGWNSELAVQNIEQATKQLGFDLYTFVMDWPEFKELQRSFFKSSVLDLDVPADHMIFGALFKTANKFGVKYLLSGNNVWTEHTLPTSWNYNKFDLVNLRHIHRTFSKQPLNHLPALGVWQHAYYHLVKGVTSVQLLNYVDYNKDIIKREISKALNWRDYGGKHHESVFTRFYQGYILPNKFQIDKRKAHLSNLIFAGQLTKQEALKELALPPYPLEMQKQDKMYIAKKLGFTLQEFENLLALPNVDHRVFKTDAAQRKTYFRMMRLLKPITRIIKNFK